MLSMAYKIIAKLIGLKLWMLLSKLVNERQIEFILGRHILEKISKTWLVFDRIIQDDKPTLFLQVDFEKAFDRVDFDYIWATIKTMGLGGKFLTLMKGLIIGVSIKMYINVQFSKPIPLEWGV